MNYEYGFTSSVTGHEIIRIHFCSYDAKKWKTIDIDTSTFDDEDKLLYDEIDLPDFGKYYVKKYNVRWVSETKNKV